jgi:hypothetical protein
MVERYHSIVDVHLLLIRGDRLLLARRSCTGYADGLLNPYEPTKPTRAVHRHQNQEDPAAAATSNPARRVWARPPQAYAHRLAEATPVCARSTGRRCAPGSSLTAKQ